MSVSVSVSADGRGARARLRFDCGFDCDCDSDSDSGFDSTAAATGPWREEGVNCFCRRGSSQVSPRSRRAIGNRHSQNAKVREEVARCESGEPAASRRGICLCCMVTRSGRDGCGKKPDQTQTVQGSRWRPVCVGFWASGLLGFWSSLVYLRYLGT